MSLSIKLKPVIQLVLLYQILWAMDIRQNKDSTFYSYARLYAEGPIAENRILDVPDNMLESIYVVSSNRTFSEKDILSKNITLQQVLDKLNPDEPNYSEAAKLGPDALPYIEQIIKTADPMLASKAAYLASLVQDKERSECVLEAAAKSPYVIVRLAVVNGVENLSPDMANKLLNMLISDPDNTVRNTALEYWYNLNLTKD